MATKEQKSYLDTLWERATLGSMIASLRQCDEISQDDLAEKLGVSRQFLNRVENNRESVDIEFAKRVAAALNYPVDPFLELLWKDKLKKK